MAKDYLSKSINAKASYLDRAGILEEVHSTPSFTVYAILSASVINGYIAGATLYIDSNNNLIADQSEFTGYYSDDNGYFSFDSTHSGAIIAAGGINTDTKLTNQLALFAALEASVISPFTTLIYAYSLEYGTSIPNVETQVQQRLKVQEDVDLLHFDPY
ncbi:hypothetical protein [Neptuniibacter sp.]|uniref:hypothetical protein n=1 Tax=Neptuniibacter sp. TaxID=1962643 RepID=UPI002605123A|nr:hypothetical protein [Neptuniibacter sp.]MCP4598775.1 hypothetical protein [Neptuniibacter sp.]